MAVGQKKGNSVWIDGKARLIAAIVSLKDVDPESWALSTSGVFQELIEKARAEIEMGKSLTLEEMRREVSAMRGARSRSVASRPKTNG